MVGHSFRFNECPRNLHAFDGRHRAALYRLIRGSVPR